MPRILNGDMSADIFLQDGDRIEVPEYVESITVTGEVFEPGAFRYDSDLKIQEYLNLAAGVTDRANVDSIYIINANGSVNLLNKNKRGSFFRFRLVILDPVWLPGH